jgi:hypothetical protein
MKMRAWRDKKVREKNHQSQRLSSTVKPTHRSFSQARTKMGRTLSNNRKQCQGPSVWQTQKEKHYNILGTPTTFAVFISNIAL